MHRDGVHITSTRSDHAEARRDSAVTYNGHPLHYQKDQGTTPTGNDVKDAGGEWYLVTPAGEKMEDHGEHEAGDDKGGRS